MREEGREEGRGRKGGREERRAGGRVEGRGGRKGGREGGRKGEREEWREGGRKGGREEGREKKKERTRRKDRTQQPCNYFRTMSNAYLYLWYLWKDNNRQRIFITTVHKFHVNTDMSAMQLRTITVNNTSINTNFQGRHTPLKMARLSVPTCLKAHAAHQWLHHNM